MEIGNIIPHIEALIFASDKPLTSMELTELINNAFGFMEEKLTLEQIQTGLDGIIEKYNSEFYPFEVRESGGGWQFLTKRDFHKTVAQLNGEKFLKRLSSAALETLSIIAYKQPITKGEIESIRGVSSDYSIQKLLEKELIVITGRNENMPGKPLVYSTSKTFMDYFGINSAADLPKLKEIFADTIIEPTVIHGAGELIPAGEGPVAEGPEEETTLIVSENGELIENEDKLEEGGNAFEGDEAEDSAEVDSATLNEEGETAQDAISDDLSTELEEEEIKEEEIEEEEIEEEEIEEEEENDVTLDSEDETQEAEEESGEIEANEEEETDDDEEETDVDEDETDEDEDEDEDADDSDENDESDKGKKK
ncbi:SMC-Scp complex subunit ScpB [Flavitalea flava]